jgi:DNA polymerase I-like protein with 3'-5' exonuclease and polymerase domains
VEIPSFITDPDPQIYLREDWLTLDLETSNIEKGTALEQGNRIILGAFYDNKRGRRASPGYDTESFGDWVARCQRRAFLVAHHAKFELQWLYRLGVTPGSVLVADTLLAEHCIRGNRRGPLDLDYVCADYGIPGKRSIVATWISEGVDPCLIPVRRLREYCENDVEITTELWLKQRSILLERGLLPVFFTRCLTALVLSEIESRGMCLDNDEVEKAYRETLERSRVLLSEIDEITGGINPRSPQQVGEFLYDKLGFREITDRTGQPIRTDSGNRKTDETTVSQLAATTVEQRRFITAFRAYIPIKKRLENLTKLYECSRPGNVGLLPAAAGPEKAILHFAFNQAVTTTHRLSSNGRKYRVQAQNIDRDLKRLFRARNDGWLIGTVDYRQLEFYVAVDLTRCPQGLEDLRNKVDVHLNTARVLYKKQEGITKPQRTAAKPFTFRPLFGGKGGSNDIRRYCRWFQNHYRGIYTTQSEWVSKVAIDKQLRLPTGLIFYWPDCTIRSDGSITHLTEIFNYPIQNFALEIVSIALVYCWYRLQAAGMKSYIINTIHDSVVFEVHPDEQEQWKEIVKWAFTQAVYRYFESTYKYRFEVCLGISYDLASHWGAGEDEEYELQPSY